MDKRTRGCLWAALGVTVALLMVGVALVVGGGYWMYQQLAPESTTLAAADAARQLDRIRAQFGDQQPIIALEHEGEDERARIVPDARKGTFTGQLESLHIAAYDPNDRNLVRFSVPFWLLRLGHQGKVTLGEDALGGVEVTEHLTVQEIEAFGPGLLIDDVRNDGGRVIVWTE